MTAACGGFFRMICRASLKVSGRGVASSCPSPRLDILLSEIWRTRSSTSPRKEFCRGKRSRQNQSSGSPLLSFIWRFLSGTGRCRGRKKGIPRFFASRKLLRLHIGPILACRRNTTHVGRSLESNTTERKASQGQKGARGEKPYDRLLSRGLLFRHRRTRA